MIIIKKWIKNKMNGILDIPKEKIGEDKMRMEPEERIILTLSEAAAPSGKSYCCR